MLFSLAFFYFSFTFFSFLSFFIFSLFSLSHLFLFSFSFSVFTLFQTSFLLYCLFNFLILYKTQRGGNLHGRLGVWVSVDLKVRVVGVLETTEEVSIALVGGYDNHTCACAHMYLRRVHIHVCRHLYVRISICVYRRWVETFRFLPLSLVYPITIPSFCHHSHLLYSPLPSTHTRHVFSL